MFGLIDIAPALKALKSGLIVGMDMAPMKHSLPERDMRAAKMPER